MVSQSENIKTRCFLLLVSQGMLPKQFVNAKTGKAVTKEIVAENYVAKVRRVCKATSSFEKKKNAHYSCLIEVISK